MLKDWDIIDPYLQTNLRGMHISFVISYLCYKFIIYIYI